MHYGMVEPPRGPFCWVRVPVSPLGRAELGDGPNIMGKGDAIP
jgi:hypothetical protein